MKRETELEISIYSNRNNSQYLTVKLKHEITVNNYSQLIFLLKIFFFLATSDIKLVLSDQIFLKLWIMLENRSENFDIGSLIFQHMVYFNDHIYNKFYLT